MGAKASTANGDDSNSRERTFSTGSASDVVAGSGFNFLRSVSNISASDRRRARSLSNVHGTGNSNTEDGNCDLENVDNENSSTDDHSVESPLSNLNLARVFTARSVPSHIWSLNGK